MRELATSFQRRTRLVARRSQHDTRVSPRVSALARGGSRATLSRAYQAYGATRAGRRITFPGRAAVNFPPSTTGVPFTSTYAIPSG